jgi:NAD(P)-dependent dehydrogenase (short-subunit alcohol dehydrogenase family)
MEMAEHKITVNGYAPGIVGTAMWDLIDEELGKKKGVQKGETINKYVTELTALGRVSVPEGRLVSFQFAINPMRFGDLSAVSSAFRPRSLGLGRIETTAISQAIQTFLDVKD